MKFAVPGVLLALVAALPMCAQEQPPAAVAVPPVTPTAPTVPPPPPVLENNGKPITAPFHCTDDDIQWAGLTCSEEDPCPIYLELAAAAAQGQTLLVVGNIHSPSITLYSALLASSDGGRTWQDTHQRVRGGGLDHIQFLDAETAWVSGLTLYPLPQDPFLLLTNDGGKTWRMRSVASDSHPGSIQQFFFSSRTEGSLLIDRGPAERADRYERFESADGGESWTIQEESTKPLRLRVSAAPPANWRIQADSATKANVLERKQGERWIPVASFAVNLGGCKPEVH